MYEESCYKISTSKYEKSNTNINISKILHLPFDMLCVINALTICKYHETTHGSEQREWNDKII